MNPSVSLIISTYNRPAALRLVLESVRRQTVMPVDVIIGDDGSRDDTRRLVEELAKGFPTRLVHVWHEDQGFRLAEIRNKSIAAAQGDYIVQIDGDMIVDRHFIEDHCRLARPRQFVKGTRVMLTEKASLRHEARGKLPQFMPGLLSSEIAKRRIKVLRLPWPGFKKSLTYKPNSTGIGANMAFWRKDCIDINGYDEGFYGWGCEDTDLMERFLRYGLTTCKTFHVAKAYHLYHPESKNPHLEESYAILRDKRLKGEIRCKNGISKWLNQK